MVGVREVNHSGSPEDKSKVLTVIVYGVARGKMVVFSRLMIWRGRGRMHADNLA